MAKIAKKKAAARAAFEGKANLTVADAIKLVKEGKFTAEDYGIYSTMKYKGSELAPLGTFEKKVPVDIVAKVKAREKEILDGKYTVKVDDSQPKSTAK